MEAHISQARQRLAQIDAAATRWEFLERTAAQRGWPERFVIALEQSLTGGADRATYSAQADVSPTTASIDLRRLVDSGLVQPRGRGRTVRYVASDPLRTSVARETGN